MINIILNQWDARIEFKVYPFKETLEFGEPVILTTVFKNISKEKVGLIVQPLFPTELDLTEWIKNFLSLILITPQGDSYFLPSFVIEYSLWPPPNFFIPLLPGESVYGRIFVYLQNFAKYQRGTSLKNLTWLNYNDLKEGKYRIKITLKFPKKSRFYKDCIFKDWECYGIYKAEVSFLFRKPLREHQIILKEFFRIKPGIIGFISDFKNENDVKKNNFKIISQLRNKIRKINLSNPLLEEYIEYYYCEFLIKDDSKYLTFITKPNGELEFILNQKAFVQLEKEVKSFQTKFSFSPLSEELGFIYLRKKFHLLRAQLNKNKNILYPEIKKIVLNYPNNMMKYFLLFNLYEREIKKISEKLYIRNLNFKEIEKIFDITQINYED